MAITSVVSGPESVFDAPGEGWTWRRHIVDTPLLYITVILFGRERSDACEPYGPMASLNLFCVYHHCH